VLRAYELGYRYNPIAAVSLDATIFYNHYDNLLNLNLVDPLAAAGPPQIHLNPTYVVIDVPYQNIGSGETHGAEMYAKVRPMRRWLLAAGLTELRGNSVNLNDSLNLPVANSVRHQFSAQSHVDLTRHVELDTALYHYNGIPAYGFGGRAYQDVPTHNRVDVGFTFHRAGGFTFALWGRDLGAGRHWENRPPLFSTVGSEVRGRAAVLKVTWQSNPEQAAK
jgi:outer membrane receptor for ferrienterochelin and colicin